MAKKRTTAKRERWKPLRLREKQPKCGLCGDTKNLTKTPCCGNWICDDEHKYKAFSYDRNSCKRNHNRYTLCGTHFNEEHDGHWKDCAKCRSMVDDEMYAYYGTNEYNFEVLDNPPSFELQKCYPCGTTIDRTLGGYSDGPEGLKCGPCSMKDFPPQLREQLNI